MDRASTIFNGTYTIASPRGGHQTFDIKTQPEDSSFAPGKRTIALLTGPDNTRHYKRFGFVSDKGISVFSKLTTKCKGAPTAWDIYAWMVWSMATQGENSHYHHIGYRLLQENTCLRCNRKLTTPESIRRGLGPECAKRS